MLCDYGAECHGAGKYETAAATFRRVLAMDGYNGAGHNGLGASLLNLGNLGAARYHLEQAVKRIPTSAAAWGNLGLLYSALNESDLGWKAFSKALSLSPNDVGVRWNRANMYLDQGKWKKGLEEYEVRIQHRGPPNFPKMPYPMWKGEDLNFKTIFIQAEQGIGDRILCSRYLHWLKNKYPTSTILYLSNCNMHSLMWGFDGLVEFIPEGIPWPKADYGLFEMSLLGIAETMPNNLYPDPGLLRKRAELDRNSVNLPAPHAPSLKVGICWTGNPIQDRNFERSCPFEQLLSLAEDPRVTLYSLQVGSKDILKAGANQLVCDLTTDIDGKLSRTAAVMLHLDLVVTVCTSVAHLAGALGVPTWVMLCHSPYWVWLRKRSDSVWYPSARLFRQPRPGDWKTVVEDVRAALEPLLVDRLEDCA